MKRCARAVAIAGLSATALLLGGCAAEEPQEAGPAFILITDSPIGQNAYLSSGKVGIEAAAEEHGGTAKVFESKDEATRASNLRSAVAEGPEIIVMVGAEFAEPAEEIAREHPRQSFLLVDGPEAEGPANLYRAEFREQETAYLLGVEAGLRTETNRIGAVITEETPILLTYVEGFADGARSVNAEVSVSDPTVIGGDVDLADTEPARRAATELAASGADQIFAVGPGTGAGTFTAAAERGFEAYGSAATHCGLEPGHVVDSSVKEAGHAVQTVIGEMLAGKSRAETTTSFGIAEGGMHVASIADGAASQCTVVEDEKLLDQVTQLSAAIAKGRLQIEAARENLD